MREATFLPVGEKNDSKWLISSSLGFPYTECTQYSLRQFKLVTKWLEGPCLQRLWLCLFSLLETFT